MSTAALHVLTALLALVGLGCCAVFYYQEHTPKGKAASAHAIMCSNGACSVLSHSRYHHVFGVPNWWFGTAFYTVVLLSLFVHHPLVPTLSLLATLGANAFSIMLIWALVFKLHIVCRVCYTSHAVNFGLLLIFATLVLRG